MEYKICVPVAIKSDDLYQNQQIITKIIEVKPDFIEFRFDYINNINNLTENFLQQLLRYVKSHIPTIFTLRHPNEGGVIHLSEDEHLETLKKLLNSHPQFLDIEMNSDIKTLNAIIEIANMKKITLIFSYHNPVSTDSFNDLIEKINYFEKTLSKNHPEKKGFLENCIYKIIFSANNFEDNLISLEICKYFNKNNKKIISFCMGEIGIFSRIVCVKFGSYLTYGFYNQKTAPGQIDFKIIRELHHLLFK